MDPVRRRHQPVLTVLVVLAVALAGHVASTPQTAPAVAQTAPPAITLTGSGWGHSVGMSQYGARAMAQAGRNGVQILQHYYPGTAVTAVASVSNDRAVQVDVFRNRPPQGSPRVDLRNLGGVDASRAPTSPVLVDVGDGVPRELTTDAAGWYVRHDVPARQYVLHAADGAELARRPDDAPIRVYAAPGGSNPGVIKVLNLGGGYAGAYQWGVLELRGAGDGAVVPVLVQPMQNYLWGIAEVPSSWERGALEAQAITARTYAGRISGVLSATPANQAYSGWDKERALNSGWKAAVDATSGQAVTYAGALAETYYSSSHGLGRSEASQDSWAYGTSRPYLVSVDDPWSAGGGNPYGSWTATASNEAFSALVGLVRTTGIRIVSRTAGGSPHVLEVTGVGLSGQTVTKTWRGDWPDRGGEPDPRGAGSKLRTSLPLTGGGAGNGRIRSQQISSIELAYSGRFRDDEGSRHETNIDALADAGVTTGCAAGPDRFCPGTPVTRAQLASFLARARGIAPSSGPDRFTDIADTGPHRGAINALAERGIVRGSGDQFSPHRAVTRAQMASFLVAGFEVPPGEGPGYTDLAGTEPHTANINSIAAKGITTGCTPTRYCPGTAVTREQMASFLARAMGIGS